jgi:Tfp pilus assembly protein PilF
MTLPDSFIVGNVSAREVLDESVLGALTAARTYLDRGDHARADRAFAEILQTAPYCTEAWFFLAVINQKHGRLAQAAELYERALILTPRFPEARNNLGVVLQALGKTHEAETCFLEALGLDPDYPEAFNNLGNIHQDQGKLLEAEYSYRQALARRPNYVRTLHHLGNVLVAMGRETEALEVYERVLRLVPDHAAVHLCRATVWLQRGEYERGWAEYEWRLRCEGQTLPPVPLPLLTGEPLEGRTILVIAEQGLGDTLQFIRYVSLVAGVGGRVTVACRKPLERILSSCPGIERVITANAVFSEFTCYAPLLSLPHLLFKIQPTVPAAVPYLSAPPELIAAWRDELGAVREFKAGVAWQGNPNHSKDRERSLRLADLEPLARVHDVKFYSLQKGFGAEQIDEARTRFPVTSLENRLDDLVDSAAVISNLDLLVTPDTSLAHLGGALGARVFLALPYSPEWRWMRDREDCPWYPTVRLFRQRRWGDWNDVFERIAGELSALVALHAR